MAVISVISNWSKKLRPLMLLLIMMIRFTEAGRVWDAANLSTASN